MEFMFGFAICKSTHLTQLTPLIIILWYRSLFDGIAIDFQ